MKNIHILIIQFAFTYLYALPAGAQEEFHLPPVTGQYAVGTVTAHLIDESRDETYTSISNDHRELVVQFFYPAGLQDGDQPAKAFPNGEHLVQAYKSKGFSFPEAFWHGIENTYGNAIAEAPAVESQIFPLLIYSHGHIGFKTENVYLLEELASHGYIVVAVDHPFDAILVRYPDERIVSDISTSASTDYSIRALDVQFVLDYLETINSNDALASIASKMDRRQVGVLGFSRGSRTSELVLADDSRFDAGAGLDLGLNAILDKPFMAIGTPSTYSSNFADYLIGGGYQCVIANTNHGDYMAAQTMMWTLFSLPGKVGQSDEPLRVHRIIADYTLAFFDKMLKAKHVPLLDGPSQGYPEVKFTIVGDPGTISSINDYQLYS